MKTYTEGELLQNEQGEPLKLFGLEKTEMVFVEAGSFIMGDGENTTEINFKEGYFIGKYPVTQELYENVMGLNPSNFKGKHRPVETVSWLDICEKQQGKESFLSKFNEKVQKNIPSLKGKGDFKLPSEAQWEYAARGGHKWNDIKFEFSGSNNINDVGWCYNPHISNPKPQTMPVGLKQPNQLGIYDFSGNVNEWIDFIPDKNIIDKVDEYMIRGGSFMDLGCRVISFRYFQYKVGFQHIGFRLVLPQFIS